MVNDPITIQVNVSMFPSSAPYNYFFMFSHFNTVIACWIGRFIPSFNVL